MSASLENNGIFLKCVDPDSGDHRAEIWAWSCEPTDSLGKLSLISTLDLLALLGKDHSVTQLGLTTQHTNAKRNTAMPWANATQHSIAMPLVFQKHAFLIEKGAAATQFALERVGSSGYIDLSSLSM